MFYFISFSIEVILDNNKKRHILVYYTNSLTHRTVTNQFDNRIYNISIIQNISYVVASIKVISIKQRERERTRERQRETDRERERQRQTQTQRQRQRYRETETESSAGQD